MTEAEKVVERITKEPIEYSPITRELLLKKRGHMVSVLYLENGYQCFAIGWFFQLTQVTARLKITSTRYENYESLDIPVEDIYALEDYRE